MNFSAIALRRAAHAENRGASHEPAARLGVAVAVAAACLALAGHAAAQTVPDAGQLLRESQPPLPRIPPPAVPPAAPVKGAADDKGPRVTVRAFVIEGASRYDDATLQAVLAPFRNRELGFAGLQEAADALAERYRGDGWHAAAVLPEQDLKDGVLRILVIEGRLGRLQITSEALPRSVPKRRAQAYFDRAMTPGQPLNLRDLARATALANELPGMLAGSVLAGGARPGETDVLLRLEPLPMVAGNVGVNNHDARSTGSTRVDANLLISSPIGWGEQISLLASASEGKRFGRGAFTVPIGPMGWRVGASASRLTYHLIGEAAQTLGSGAPNGARGDADSVGLNASYPLLRHNLVSANLLISQEHRSTRNETALGPTSDKRTDVTSITLQGDLTDGLLGGGVTSSVLTLTHGRVDLSRIALDLQTDQLGANTQGRYTRFNLTLSRLQRINDRNTLWASVSAQGANRNLDAGEKFALGGPQGVRAFPLLEGTGDEGAMVNLSWRHQWSPTLRFETFYDTGRVRRSKTVYPGAGTPEGYTLDGVGVGVDWSPAPAWRVNAVVAQRLSDNPAALPSGRDSDGTQRQPRLWLNASFSF